MNFRYNLKSLSFRPAMGVAALFLSAIPFTSHAELQTEDAALNHFNNVIRPILENHCYDCHGDGSSKGSVALDELLSKEDLLENPKFWHKVLRNTRSDIMPPPDEPQLTDEEQQALEDWIKTGAFRLDPEQPDPGRVTIRSLNRTEYRNTMRDLLGVEIDTDVALLPDDVGYGFDNIGDVLSISPIRLERFIEAAIAAVKMAVPTENVAMSSELVIGDDYLTADGSENAAKMSYYRPNEYSHTYNITEPGQYRVILNTKLDGEASPVDPQHAHVVWSVNGEQFFEAEYEWHDMNYLTDEFVFDWETGEHVVTVKIEPVYPELQPLRTKMEYRLLWVTLDGPLDPSQWKAPPGYDRFFTRDEAPEDPVERRAYAKEVISDFAPKAYRRPVDDETIEKLVDLAETTYSVPGTTFEKGVAQAIVALLSSPRFLFHVENAEPVENGEQFAELDEYSLASRLSYALWASMPDEELMELASRGELRNNFRAQVDRMMADPKAGAFARNFAGQWLQSRAVLDVQINSEVVMESEKDPEAEEQADASDANAPAGNIFAQAAPEDGAGFGQARGAATDGAELGRGRGAAGQGRGQFGPGRGAAGQGRGQFGQGRGRGGFGGFGRGRGRGAEPGTELTKEVREAMKQEVEEYFAYIVEGDRSVLELLQSDYTFVNEELAAVYGIDGVTGSEMRRVDLPEDSARGGVITMGSVLTVTSNPTRTSPVKRGKWILENILGAPPPPPPPNVPALEDSKKEGELKAPTQRELLALHRADPLCASCHERMDPPGLALENFNAFGRYRTQEFGQDIEAYGELATGEEFTNVKDFKQAIVDNHHLKFYHTLTEKLMTYVLGRGIEYYDVPTVDSIVEQLEKDNGQFSTLLYGVLESAPFQKRRTTPNTPTGTGVAETVAKTESNENAL